MASVCRQRALTDKAQRNTPGSGAEPDRVQRLAKANAVETVTHKTHSSSEGEITHKDLGRQTEKNAGRGQDEDKQSKETSHTMSPQFNVLTPGQQTPECTSTVSGSPSREPNRSEIQDPGPGGPTSQLNRLGAPPAQTELPSQIKTNSPQNSPPSTDQAQPTTASHSSSNLAAASSSHSLHQQNFTSPQDNPTTATAQNHPAENDDELSVHSATTHPPTHIVLTSLSPV